MRQFLAVIPLIFSLAAVGQTARNVEPANARFAQGLHARLSKVAAAVDIADQAALQRGGRTQVAVLGTSHLRDAPKSLTAPAFDALLARLAAFKPDLVAVESMSGAQCDYLRAYVFAYEGAAEARCFDTSAARAQLKLDGAAAEKAIEAMLSSGRDLAPAQRRRLAALLLAAGELDSACVQWLRLPATQRVADADLTAELIGQIDMKLSQRSEDTLIAIPLAVKLGLDRIFPVDDHTGDRATGPYDDAVYGADMARLWNNPHAATRQKLHAQARDGAVTSGDVLGWYRYMNSAGEARLALAGDFAAAAADPGKHRTGRAYLAYWETRNLRMAANIREVVGRTQSNRAVTIVGASHKPYYERYLGVMSDIEVVNMDKMLR